MEAADDSAPFDDTARNLSGRSRAPVHVAWEPAPWNTERETSPEQRTPDLSALVQAVVDRPGWASGNHMVFLITGSVRRTAQSHDKEGGVSPRLSVRFAVGEPFRRGDANGDGMFDLADPIATLGDLFLGTQAIPCLDAADADDQGSLDISDAIYSLSYQFLGGPPPASPFPGCGDDPTADDLGCGGHPECR